jgi:hypothetical protein
MTHRSSARRRSKRILLAFLASALLPFGSPFMANSSADTGNGAHRNVSANFGDCKNENTGVHNGYDCPVSSGGGGSTTTAYAT